MLEDLKEVDRNGAAPSFNTVLNSVALPEMLQAGDKSGHALEEVILVLEAQVRGSMGCIPFRLIGVLVFVI